MLTLHSLCFEGVGPIPYLCSGIGDAIFARLLTVLVEFENLFLANLRYSKDPEHFELSYWWKHSGLSLCLLSHTHSGMFTIHGDGCCCRRDGDCAFVGYQTYGIRIVLFAIVIYCMSSFYKMLGLHAQKLDKESRDKNEEFY